MPDEGGAGPGDDAGAAADEGEEPKGDTAQGGDDGEAAADDGPPTPTGADAADGDADTP